MGPIGPGGLELRSWSWWTCDLKLVNCSCRVGGNGCVETDWREAEGLVLRGDAVKRGRGLRVQ